MVAYLQSREEETTTRIEINRVEEFTSINDLEYEKDSEYSIFAAKDRDGMIGEEARNSSCYKGIKKYGFNYGAMISYAGKYNGACPTKISNRNPAYANYDGIGGDCTNYASQILRAGGAPMDDTGSYQWYYYSSNNRCCWTGVSDLYNII